MSSFLYGKDLDALRKVTVDLGGGKEEVVQLDPERGPLRLNIDGGMSFTNTGRQNVFYKGADSTNMGEQYKTWRQFTSTEKEVTITQVAKMNACMRERCEAEKARVAAVN
mmetsp:Transcript_114289/g.334145  ORF Transcript_114289/g.334145 Transcript_114289/m.334145 type:complete len:110 (+) Transcript_114289:64-393(+)